VIHLLSCSYEKRIIKISLQISPWINWRQIVHWQEWNKPLIDLIDPMWGLTGQHGEDQWLNQHTQRTQRNVITTDTHLKTQVLKSHELEVTNPTLMAETNISPHNTVGTTKQADPLHGFGWIDGSDLLIQPTPHAFLVTSLYSLIWDFFLSQINIWTTTTWSNVWVVLPKPSWYEFLIGFLIWTPTSKHLHLTTFSNICVILSTFLYL
jgi:hypothetical protein